MKILLLLLLFAVVPSWVAVDPGSFATRMPHLPTLSRSLSATPLGQVTTYLYTCNVSYGSYSVTFTDLPRAAVTFASGRVLEDAKDALLKDAGAELVSWSDGDLSYRSARQQGWSQIRLRGTRLFVSDVRVAKGTSKRNLVDPFFRSLVLR